MARLTQALSLMIFLAILAVCVAVGTVTLINAGFDIIARLILPVSY
jgi:hypothetical protein